MSESLGLTYDDFNTPLEYEAYILTEAFGKLNATINKGHCYNLLVAYFMLIDAAPEEHTVDEFLTMVDEVLMGPPGDTIETH